MSISNCAIIQPYHNMHILGVLEHTLGSVLHPKVNSMVDNDTPNQEAEACYRLQTVSDVLIFGSLP